MGEANESLKARGDSALWIGAGRAAKRAGFRGFLILGGTLMGAGLGLAAAVSVVLWGIAGAQLWSEGSLLLPVFVDRPLLAGLAAVGLAGMAAALAWAPPCLQDPAPPAWSPSRARRALATAAWLARRAARRSWVVWDALLDQIGIRAGFGELRGGGPTGWAAAIVLAKVAAMGVAAVGMCFLLSAPLLVAGVAAGVLGEGRRRVAAQAAFLSASGGGALSMRLVSKARWGMVWMAKCLAGISIILILSVGAVVGFLWLPLEFAIAVGGWPLKSVVSGWAWGALGAWIALSWRGWTAPWGNPSTFQQWGGWGPPPWSRAWGAMAARLEGMGKWWVFLGGSSSIADLVDAMDWPQARRSAWSEWPIFVAWPVFALAWVLSAPMGWLAFLCLPRCWATIARGEGSMAVARLLPAGKAWWSHASERAKTARRALELEGRSTAEFAAAERSALQELSAAPSSGRQKAKRL